MRCQNHKNNIFKLFTIYAELGEIITININMCVKELEECSLIKTHCVCACARAFLNEIVNNNYFLL